MAENPTASPPKPQQPQLLNGGGDPIGTPSSSTSQNPNTATNSNNLPSTPVPPSPSHSQISSPRLPPLPQTPHQNQINQIQSQQQLQQLQQLRQQQQQNMIQQQQGMLQRSGSVSRIREIQQQFEAAAVASAMRQHAGMYGGQMNFAAASNMQQQQQQVQQQQQQQISGGVMSQVGIMGQGSTVGQMPMLAGQATAATQINLQNQMLGQQRQRAGLLQGSQFHPANVSGQSLQGMQAIGMAGSLGLNSQVRANGPSSYATQRINQGQIRQQQLSQSQVTSSQKVPSQDMTRTSPLALMNSQLSGLTQNGQTTIMQNPVTQQQWLKQNPLPMAVQGSPSYQLQQQQRQQQAFLQQQLRNLPLNQQQISQLLQQQPQLGSQQQQHLQGQQAHSVQQQQSPRTSGPASQKSMSLTAIPDTPGVSSFQGAEMSSQLLGKRKIQDLVSQVDPQVKLDPALEDVLLEMADDFIDSVTTFACNLAKHRKSSILEPKDLLLHLEKNWRLKIPGLQREEQRNQKTMSPTDAHKRRLEMIRSQVESQSELDAINVKGAAGQLGNDATVDRIIRSSTSSEQLILPATATNMLQKIPRF